jgi:hypothetical protein
MSATHTWEPHGLHGRLTGTVSAAELLHATMEVQADPRFDELHYMLIDYTEVTAIDLADKAMDEVRALRAAGQRSNPWIRVAVIAADPGLRVELQSSAELQEMPYVCRLFDNEYDARQWVMGGNADEESARTPRQAELNLFSLQ